MAKEGVQLKLWTQTFLWCRNLSGCTIAHIRAFLHPGEHDFNLMLSTPGIHLATLVYRAPRLRGQGAFFWAID